MPGPNKQHTIRHRSALSRRTLIGAAGASLLAAPAIVEAQSQAGVALVIGNSKYQWEAQLPNVRRDAPDIAKVFQAMGLKTELVQDQGRDGMRRAVESFGAAARGANFAAFYFAGHGAGWKNDTYLVPTDIDLGTPSLVETLYSTRTIAEGTQQASHRLLVFDNCRNNPADGWRQVQAERSAVVNAGQQTGASVPARSANRLALYSTAPGRVALDGPPGDNSPFAAALMRQLDAPSVDLRTMAPKLRRDLLIATEGRQVLWDLNSFQDSFALKGAAGKAPANRSTWANDPSRILELPGAYAYARESRFTLPEGLIAHRSTAAGRDGRMIGAFKFTGDSGAGRQPQLLIVMSVEEGQRAEIILAGLSEKGQYWRFVTGPIAGGKLDFVPRDASGRVVFDWKDANTGTVTMFPPSSQTTGRISASAFTRLDG